MDIIKGGYSSKDTDATEDKETTDIQRESRERSNANLKPFKPGQSGNPAGRPIKALTITSLLRDKLDQIDPKTRETYAQGIVKAMLAQACKDPQVLKELLNRCEGKVTDTVDIQGTNVTITYELTKRGES